MHTVYDHLVTVLTGKFEVGPEEIRPEVTLDELGLDSLAVTELLITLQDRWGVPLEPDDSAAGQSLRQLADAVQAHLAAAGQGSAGPGALP
ncbi:MULTISPECIES: acyl carrier protein [Streptomyces]|uniref:Acyl carrier protein n=1 Tax=Streptomyces morookaense TaxID=1970 RepID=A0A7Y7E9S1_STRMO|nr:MULTISPECIES: acyl carrier protein [Streptomyces]MCC2274030.1 acyl carrier protein [Streptomyces sp. ET3-23]NVK81333.1 acyl carrier protein [Streptomyces morookaense]GHF35479.1 hypothetical protein GCM10010359_42580 [Streptomyces morookaense]